jgi:DNA gyrase subunit A
VAGGSESYWLVSDQGCVFPVRDRVVANLERGELFRRPSEFLHLTTGERLQFVVARAELSAKSRIMHVTAQGKLKATACSDYERIDEAGGPAYLLGADDYAIAVFSEHSGDTVFCLASSGKGIHFETSDVRSMGRKAVGVVAMKLEPKSVLLAAFNSTGHEHVVFITDRGLAKRVPLGEFRAQGRAGGGMIACNPVPGQRLVGAVGSSDSDDLLVITESGCIARIPARLAPPKSRAAKPEPLFDLPRGDRIVALQALPPGEMGEVARTGD